MKSGFRRQLELLGVIEQLDTDGGGVSFSNKSALAKKRWAGHILKVVDAGQDIDQFGMYQLEQLEKKGFLSIEFHAEWQTVFSLTPIGHQYLESERENVWWRKWPRQLFKNIPTIIFSVLTALIIGWVLKVFGPN